MHQTLFHIPSTVPGTEIPVFGWGLLLAVWAVFSGGLVIGLVWRRGFSDEARGYLPILALVGLAIWLLLPHLTEKRRFRTPNAEAPSGYTERVEDLGLPIRGYGTMLLVAVTAGVGLAAYQARRMGVAPDVIYALAFWMFLAGIVGARLFYIIEYWRDFRTGPGGETLAWRQTLVDSLNIAQGGLVVYGSVIGAGLATVVFLIKHRLPALAMCDLVAPSLVLGLAIGRVGCLLNGCCHGGPSTAPWALSFPWASPPHAAQVERGQVFLHGLLFDRAQDRAAVIERVEPDSPAEQQGLAPGMRVTRVAGEPVVTRWQAQLALLDLAGQGRRVEISTDAGVTAAWTLDGPPPGSLPVHPTQVYSTVNAALLCLFLWAYYPFRRRDGESTALLLTLYPVSRYLLEIIRTDEVGMFGTSLSISQWVSLGVLLLAAGLWGRLLRGPRGLALPLPKPAAGGPQAV